MAHLTDAKGKLIRWLPALAWLGVMIFLSRQTGSETVQLSGQLARVLAELLARFGFSVHFETFHRALRTAAHFIAYFIWAMLLFGAVCGEERSGRWKTTLWTLAICGAVAVLDELQKTWIPGRHCSWDEAALNCVGALGGTVFRSCLRRFRTKKKADVV